MKSKSKYTNVFVKILCLVQQVDQRDSAIPKKMSLSLEAGVIYNVQRGVKNKTALSPSCMMLTQQPVIQFTARWRVQLLTLTLLNFANINHITVWVQSLFCDVGSRLLIRTLRAAACSHVLAGGLRGRWCTPNIACGPLKLSQPFGTKCLTTGNGKQPINLWCAQTQKDKAMGCDVPYTLQE